MAQAQTFTNFKFTAQALGWNVDLVGVVKDNKITFTTQRWIENMANLPATFELDGAYEVKVGGVVQTSPAGRHIAQLSGHLQCRSNHQEICNCHLWSEIE